MLRRCRPALFGLLFAASGMHANASEELRTYLAGAEGAALPAETRAELSRVSALLEAELGAVTVGQVGHVLILFRRQEDPEKRVIELPRVLDVD